MPVHQQDADEQRLVTQANDGDAAAFATLYRRHRDWVLMLAWRWCGNQADALDVMQDTFAYFFSQFPGFVLTSSLRAYLYPVVKHRCISLGRKRQKLVSLDAARVANDEAYAPLHWHDETEGDLERMISLLPADQQEVLRLRFGMDFKLEEIAKSLGIALGTVKSRLHNALKQLKNIHF